MAEPDAETDNSDLYDLTEYYIRNPVNLNNASVEDLSSLPYLDLFSARLIIKHRKTFGTFFSTNELYSVSGIPAEVIQKILPLLSIEDNSSRQEWSAIDVHKISLMFRNRVLYDLQERKGFKNNLFKGNPYKLYSRLTANYSKNMEMGFLAEKDPGEKSYYDFHSGFISISNFDHFQNILIGDYLIEFGQGLSLWSPYSVSKGSDAVYSVKRRPGAIKPYKSAAENNFFRGAAFVYDREHVKISAFYSRNALDANIDSLSGKITSTPQTGLHRTNSEILNRKSVVEKLFGMSLIYYFPAFISAGILYYGSEFNRAFRASKVYDINGSIFKYYSTYIDLYLNNINIFGEAAFNGNSVAFVSGFKFSPSAEFIYVLSLRGYPKNFTSLHGYGFGEKPGALQNEYGVYNGLRWRTSFASFNLYYDQFKFPFATSQNPLPTEGYEFMIKSMINPSNDLNLYFRLKLENKEITEILDMQSVIVRRLRQSYRVELTYRPLKNLRLKTRVEYNKHFIKKTCTVEEGYLIFQDLRLQSKADLTLYLRVIFFQTDSFNSSIFEYENDLTGILSNVGLYGEGARLYLVIRYKLLNWLSLSLKYSETYKPSETSMGSGYQSINGNIDNRIGIQLDINY